MDQPKKSMGQHWLNDDYVLEQIVQIAKIESADYILEIGPGPGSLTAKLLQTDAKLIAVEKDEQLARNLTINIKKLNISSGQIAKNLQIVEADILTFDLSKLPRSYKVVANIPYYLTSNLIRILCESSNPPATITLLVQKEVAERICAEPGKMSLLSVSAQAYYETKLEIIVPAAKFRPPPKVDSQVVHMVRLAKPVFSNLGSRQFFRVVKAGFSARRKTLLNSLSGGLNLPKEKIQEVLESSQIDPKARPQELTLNQWLKLTKYFNT